MKNRGKLFIVSAPSGAGKSTLVAAVLERIRHQCAIERIVTYTSRAIRPGEEPGKDYRYISELEFLRKVEEGFFLEWSNGLGHYYGTQKSIVQDLQLGKSGVLVIDRVGAAQILRQVNEAILVWIQVPSLAALEQRLVRRGTETVEQIQRRLLRAAQEMAEEDEKKFYHHHIINDIFESAAKEMEQIIVSRMSEL